MTRVHPFEVTVLVLVGTGLLPIGVAWKALVWTVATVGGALVLRSLGDRRKTELARATLGMQRPPCAVARTELPPK